MCSGCVRHVRGVYDSANILSEISCDPQHTTSPTHVRLKTYIFSSLLHPILADVYNVGLLARRLEKRGATAERDSPRVRIRSWGRRG